MGFIVFDWLAGGLERLAELYYWFIGLCTATPAAQALIGAHYVPFAAIGWGVFAVRAVRRRCSAREWLLFGVFSIAIAVEGVQLFADRRDFFNGDTWGLPRYFGVFAPLLWMWTAWAASAIWNAVRNPYAKWTLRTLVALSLAWIFVSQNIMTIADVYRSGAHPDAAIAAKRIAEVIRSDYAGPARQERPRRVMGEYFTTRRPVVFSDFAAAAWEVRGQSEGAIQSTGLCPYPDDYLFIRVGSGYGNIETVDSTKYDYVTTVRGQDELGTKWRLFRRKTTPHRLKR